MTGEEKEEFPPLLPLGFHPMDIAQIRELCVSQFPRSATRQEIMTGLEAVLSRLNASGLALEVWIDGSFVTEKLDPEDSDIAVRYWGHELDSASPDQLEIIEWAASTQPQFDHKCHCFPFPEWRKTDSLHDHGQWRRAYWLRQFGFSRQDQPKGLAVVELPLSVRHE
jgi:hypothetical protein